MSDDDRRALRRILDEVGRIDLEAARRRDSEALDRQQRGLISMWTLWMVWFTWFFGTQIAVLWNRQDVLNDPLLSFIIARSWLFNSAAGALMALLVTSYTLAAGRKHPGIGFPTTFAAIGAFLNSVALLLNCLLWYHLQ